MQTGKTGKIAVRRPELIYPMGKTKGSDTGIVHFRPPSLGGIEYMFQVMKVGFTVFPDSCKSRAVHPATHLQKCVG